MSSLSGKALPAAAAQPPAAARRVFGAALPTALAYAGLLTGAGVERGLIGPAEAGRIWERHLLNCAVLTELVPGSCRLADLGSGAGLPGLVLAMMLPETDVVLVEPMARRTTFLHECVSALGLTNVEVKRGRAQDFAGRLGADVVVARAVAGLDRLVPLAVGLSRPGGLVLAIKGASAQQEVAAARPVLELFGIANVEILQVGTGLGAACRPATVVRFQAAAESATAARARRTTVGTGAVGTGAVGKGVGSAHAG